ncbi:MAG: tetratricopeptide repeat protein [Ilumatobacteraceae bacterium]
MSQRWIHEWAALTVVRGPAGAGKTRYVLDRIDIHRTVWVRLHDLYHPSELAITLVGQLRSRVPNLAPILSAAVGPSNGPVSDSDPLGRSEQLGSLIAAALRDALDRRLLLVIDGVERLGSDPVAARLVEALVRNAPAELALALITRDALPFSIDRLPLDDVVHQVELPATGDPLVHDLIAAADLEPDVAATLEDLTGDRPGAALTLVAALGATTREDHRNLVRRWAGAADPVAAATEHSIACLVPDHAQLLRVISGLQPVAAHELERAGLVQVDAAIHALLHAQLIEDVEGGGRVRAKQLTMEILDRRVDADLATSMIDMCAGRGDPGAAIRVSLEQRQDLLPNTLERFGVAAIEAGQPQLVLDAIAASATASELHGLNGRAAHALGDARRAIAEYQLAAQQRSTAGDAWRHGLLEYFQGQHERALAIYGKAIAALHPDDDPADVALLAGYAGAAAWITGSLDTAREHSAQALAVGSASGDDAALAVAHTLAALVAASDGERMLNDWNYVRALQHAERAGDVMQIARIRSNRGSRLLEEGEYDLALVELDDAVRHADLGGYGVVLALAMTNRGEVLTRLGRLDDARTDLATAVDLLQHHGSLLVAYPLTVLARLYLIRGDIEQARGAAERALATSEQGNDQQIAVAASLQLARALASSDPDVSQLLIDRVAGSDGSLDAAEVWSLKAAVALDRGDRAEAVAAATRAAAIARRRRDRFALASALEVGALAEATIELRRRRLDEARALFEELGCVLDAARVEVRLAAQSTDPVVGARLAAVADLARRRGARALAAEAEAARRGAEIADSLSVTTLGTFSITRLGVPVPNNSWQSKKARDLFKMLVVLDGRPLPRDQAIDRLWGDDSAASNKLSVALATMRSVLDPDKRFDPDHFVQADAESIRCNPDTIDSDLRRFLTLAHTALREQRATPGPSATELLSIAEAAYTGDVLESDPYADWFVNARESARSVYLSVAQTLATVRAQDGSPDDAIRLWLRVLEHEPYDESAHLALVSTLVAVGRHGDARRRYQHYSERMHELELEPRAFPAT